MTMLPSAPNARAVAAPIPVLAPVISTTLSFRSRVIGVSRNGSDQRASCDEGRHVIYDQLTHCGAGLTRGARLMRLQHDVVEREQRFRHLRLARKYVKPGAAEATRGQQ